MRIRKPAFGGWPVLTALAVVAVTVAPANAQENRGWLGVRLDCSQCSYKESPGSTVWSFSVPPLIQMVAEGGPAAESGLRGGDTIVAIDGVQITTPEGGRRFGAIAVDEPVTFTVQRDGRELSVEVVPGTRGDAFGEMAGPELDGRWDSVLVHIKSLYEEQVQLQRALHQAEAVLQRTQARAVETSAETDRQTLATLRTQIDSIRRELKSTRLMIRSQADSLAVRTIYVKPGQVRAPDRGGDPAEAAGSVEAITAKVMAPYGNAVAGAKFEELSEDLAAYFPGVNEGLLVTKVVAGTPAFDAGLREGDVVVSVNGRPVPTVAELRTSLSGSGEAEVLYVRKGKQLKCKISSQ